MSGWDDPWMLPCSRRFLEDVAEHVYTGGALLSGGPSMPHDPLHALDRYLRELEPDVVARRDEADAGARPLEHVAGVLGYGITSVEELATSPELAMHVVMIDLSKIPTAEKLGDWSVFLSRFIDRRREAWSGLSLFVQVTDGRRPDIPSLPHEEWGGRFRRLDAAIWADLHARSTRWGPMDELAGALATELGGWNLTVVKAFAEADAEALMEPLNFLDSLEDRPQGSEDSDKLDGRHWVCSLSLRAAAPTDELRTRVWRAQLRALFPWIEEIRQQVILRHRRRLAVDDHQRALGAQSVEDIEVGGLFVQLRSTVPPREADFLRAIWNIRNDLAHRKSARASDLSLAISTCGASGYGQ